MQRVLHSKKKNESTSRQLRAKKCATEIDDTTEENIQRKKKTKKNKTNGKCTLVFPPSSQSGDEPTGTAAESAVFPDRLFPATSRFTSKKKAINKLQQQRQHSARRECSGVGETEKKNDEAQNCTPHTKLEGLIFLFCFCFFFGRR